MSRLAWIMVKKMGEGGMGRLFLLVILLVILSVGLVAAILVSQRQTYNPSQASAAPLPSSVNLLVNGGFNQGLSGWDKIKSVTVDRGNTAADQRVKGNVTLKLTSGAVGSGISQRLILPAEAATYTLSGYYKPVKNIGVISPSLFVIGKTTKQKVVPLTESDDSAHPGWRFFTGAFSLSWQDYSDLYNASLSGFSVDLSLTFPATAQTVLLDDWKIAVNDDSNIIQDPGFGAWKNSGDLYAWGKHNAKVTKPMPSAVSVGLVNVNKSAYLDQDISKLIVKGGDYDLTVSVKDGPGWVSVSHEVVSQQPGFNSNSILKPRPVFALDADFQANSANGGPSDQYRCNPGESSTDEKGNLHTVYSCRYYFIARTDFTTITKTIHIDNNASKVWINLGVSNKTAKTTASFANVSLEYHAALASTAPVLLKPGNGSVISDATPTLSWQKPSGFGNSLVMQYRYEVSTSSDVKTDGSFKTTVLNTTMRADTNPEVRQIRSLSDGQYFWHVLAINDSGQKSPWSDVWSFTVDTMRPVVSKSGIQVTLGDQPNTGQVTISWSASNDPRLDPSFDHFEYAVKDAGGKVLVSGKAVVASGVYSYVMPMLTLNNGDYVSQWTIVDKAGNRRLESDRFGYFEDGFGRSSLSSPWESSVAADSKILISNGVVNIEDQGKSQKEGWTRIMRTFDASNAFAVSVNSASMTTNNPLKGLAFAGLVVEQPGWLNGIGRYISTLDNKSLIGQITLGGTSPDWVQSGMPSPVALSSPINFSLTYNGTTWTTYYNGQFMASSSSMWGNIKEATKIGIGILSSKPNFPAISASFDDFRLIWVK